MTKLPVPDEYIDECDWDDYIAENLPAFSKLKGAGKVDEFQTLKVLMGSTTTPSGEIATKSYSVCY